MIVPLLPRGVRAHPTRARSVAMGCLAALVVGCDDPGVAEGLLSVSGVVEAALAPGAPLRLSAEGLPAGRTGRLRFTGRRQGPGTEPAPVDEWLAATAVQEDRVIVDLAPLRPRPGEAFSGEGELSFRSSAGPRITGRANALAFRVLGDPPPAVRLALESRVDDALVARGWVLEDTPGGVRVARSPADAPLRIGDRVVAASGFPVQRRVDLLRGDGGVLGPLEVVGPDGGGPRRIVPVTGVAGRAVLGVLDGSGLPVAACLAWLGAVVLAGRRSPSSGFRPRARTVPAPAVRVAQAAALVAPAAAASPALAGDGSPGLLAVWSVVLVLRTVASPRLRWTPAHLLVAVLRAAAAVAPLGLVFVAIAAVTGVDGLRELVIWQGARRIPALALTFPPMLLAVLPLARVADLPGPGLGPATLRAMVAGVSGTVLLGGPAVLPGVAGAAGAAGIAVALLMMLERRATTVLPAWAWLGAGLAALGSIGWAATPSATAFAVVQIVVAVAMLAPVGAMVLRRSKLVPVGVHPSS